MSERENAGANGGPGAGANGEEEAEEEEGEVFLYGEWQTEPWDPPAAKDGVVPKNDRGNVDLHGAAYLPRDGSRQPAEDREGRQNARDRLRRRARGVRVSPGR